jgi:tetratricopeptide (TPR) repeat protein
MASRAPTFLRTLAKRRDILLGVPALALLLAGLTVYIYYPAWQASRHWRQAEAAIEARDFAKACQHLGKYVAAHPGSSEGHFLLARSLRRAGRLDEARIRLEQAQRLGWPQEQIELEQTLAQVQQRGVRGGEVEALTALVRARHPDERIILEAMVQGDKNVVQFQQAGKWLNLWVEHFPDDWLARFWRAEHLQSFAHFDEARTDYLKVLELRPGHDEAHLRLGLLALADRSQVAQAEEHLQKYLAAHPDHPEALLGLARCRREQGDLPGALATTARVLERHPHHAEAALLAGTIEAERGEHEAALPWLRRALAADADPQATHFQLAQALKRLGKTEEADMHERRFKLLEQTKPALDAALLGILKEPANPARHHEAGRLYLDVDLGAKAERYFHAALRLDAGHRPSHEALARYYDSIKRTDLAEMHRRNVK